MPTTIPFDPALVLGNIVDPKKITALEAIATAQEPIDSSQQKLNDLILSRRSMDMTLQEMVNLGVDAEHLDKLTEEIKTLTDTMANAAVELGEAVVKAEGDIQKARAEAGQIKINDAIESPIDYNKSALKQLPLSSDTMTLNVQFFRKETEDDRSSAYANSIATYVSAQCSGFLSPRCPRPSPPAPRKRSSRRAPGTGRRAHWSLPRTARTARPRSGLLYSRRREGRPGLERDLPLRPDQRHRCRVGERRD